MKAKWNLFLFLMSFGLTSSVFAEGNESVLPPPDQNFMQTLVMIGIGLLFFYIILWRPEQKRRQAIESQRASLKQGDRVVAMGIIGSVVRIDQDTVILKMYDGSKIEVYKAAINDILSDEEKKIEN